MSRRGGTWIQRWRVPLGFLCGAAFIFFAHPTPRTLLIGSSVSLLGLALRAWAAGHLEKGREVTVSGPYRLTRHPLYAGSSIMGLGFAIASNSLAAAALAAAYLALTIGAAIRSEERHLTEKFGSAYPDYREGRQQEIARRFSLERAMRNREYRSMAGLAGMLALLLWKAL